MILHTLNATPSSAPFAQCLALATAQDCILLMGSGVYGALDASEGWRQLSASPAKICALRPDVQAAGVEARLAAVELVDYDGFVALSERFPRQLAWY
ncbi:sulfurtransferase complex subunit TusB [Haliea sp. E17]|uniref:sulfurtransferase complex subunit TusB n=1 Tax=Haliea sp. E17 TaxID=3401576 RepID=UPI003AAA2639